MNAPTTQKITVEDVLKLDYFKHHELVAGKGGLGNEVENATVFESETVAYVPAKTFISTTASAFANKPESLVAWLDALTDSGVSAIAIKTSKHIGSIHQEAIDLCNQRNVPLLESPPNSSPATFTSSVLKLVFSTERNRRDSNDSLERFFAQAIKFPACSPEQQASLRVKARALECRLDIPYVIFLLSLEATDPKRHTALNTLLAHARAQDPFAWGVLSKHRAIVVYHPSSLQQPSSTIDPQTNALANRIAAEMSTASHRVYVSSPAIGIEEFCLTYQSLCFMQLTCECTSAPDDGKPLCASKVGNMYYLYKIYEDQKLRRSIVKSRIEDPLRDLTPTRKAEILDTLREYLRSNGSVKEVSETLHTHPNTVAYRLKTLEELTECNVKESRVRSDLWTAMILYDLENAGASDLF